MSVHATLDVSTRPTPAIPSARGEVMARPTRPARGATHGTQPTRSFLVDGLGREVEVKIATERAEFEQAFQLLAANYQARGYEPASTKIFRFTAYHILPETVTLVAKHAGRVIATMSLVPDTALLGLPMESIYGPEIARLRRQGRRLGEVTSLAFETSLSTREFIKVFKALIRLQMQYHVRQGGDSWVITVNPRHRSFYRKAMGFVPLGPQRSYPAVQDHPAEAYLLDLDLMRAGGPEMYQEVFGTPLPEPVLTASGWSPELVRHLGGGSTQVDHRTLESLLLRIANLGSAPRWLEDETGFDRAPRRNPDLGSRSRPTRSRRSPQSSPTRSSGSSMVGTGSAPALSRITRPARRSAWSGATQESAASSGAVSRLAS
jgi:hypothetical protein